MGRKPIKDTKIEKRWMTDICGALQILTTFLHNEKTIFAHLLESQIKELELDLEKHTGLSLEAANLKTMDGSQKFISDLYHWYEEEYRPQVISNDILQPITERPDSLSLAARKRLSTLCEISLKAFSEIDNPKEQGFETKLVEDIKYFALSCLQQLEKV